MRKMTGRIAVCFLVAVFLFCGTLVADRQKLHQELIRLHVVAASDSQTDQLRKIQVRDAIIRSLENDISMIADAEEAKHYLQQKLPVIQRVAERTLTKLGCPDSVTVSLCEEAFSTRVYDTFVLPAGIYNALRIVIGDGQGKNWWCVVFPGLCIPAASDGVRTVAAGAGFPESLAGALTGEDGYELRFVLLDAMGKLENILFEP